MREMIEGVIVILRSGLMVAQVGFEESERQQILSALIGAMQGIADLLGAGKFRSVEMDDKRLHVISGIENPDVIVAVLSDKRDASAPFIAKRVITEVEKIIPKGMEIVDKKLEKMVTDTIEKIIQRRELPEVEQIRNLATLIYGAFSPSLIEKTNLEFDRMVKSEYEAEQRMVLKPAIKKYSLPPEIEAELFNECLDLAFKWDLYDAYERAMIVRANSKMYNDIAGLVAAKIALMLCALPDKYKRVPPDAVEEILSTKVREEFEEFREFLIKYAQYVFHGKRREFMDFLRTKYSALIDKLFELKDELLQKAALFILFDRHRELAFHKKFEDILQKLKEYEIAYEILYNARKQLEIFSILYRFKHWREVEQYYSESKLKYLDAQKKFDKILKQKSLFARIFSLGKRKAELIKAAHILLLRMETLLLSSIAAIEAYGLEIRDRDKIIYDVYNTVLKDAYEIIKANPPTAYNRYFNFYQLFLHLIYYRTFLASEKDKAMLAKEMFEISRMAFNMFLRLYLRKRIPYSVFLRIVNPIAFTLAKASLKMKNVPEELLFYVKMISELPQEIINEINRERERWNTFYINFLDVALSVCRMITVEATKKNVLEKLLKLSEDIIEWLIYRGELSREIIDDFADVIENAIEHLEKDICIKALEKLIYYTNILVGDPKENKFEAAILYERLGEVVMRYVNRFGIDSLLVKKVIKLLETARDIWSEEGYTEKVEKISKYLGKLAAT